MRNLKRKKSRQSVRLERTGRQVHSLLDRISLVEQRCAMLESRVEELESQRRSLTRREVEEIAYGAQPRRGFGRAF